MKDVVVLIFTRIKDTFKKNKNHLDPQGLRQSAVHQVLIVALQMDPSSDTGETAIPAECS